MGDAGIERLEPDPDAPITRFPATRASIPASRRIEWIEEDLTPVRWLRVFDESGLRAIGLLQIEARHA